MGEGLASQRSQGSREGENLLPAAAQRTQDWGEVWWQLTLGTVPLEEAGHAPADSPVSL